jgi:hypothetical protein
MATFLGQPICPVCELFFIGLFEKQCSDISGRLRQSQSICEEISGRAPAVLFCIMESINEPVFDGLHLMVVCKKLRFVMFLTNG